MSFVIEKIFERTKIVSQKMLRQAQHDKAVCHHEPVEGYIREYVSTNYA